jgi:predicted HTH transcriptional regulator
MQKRLNKEVTETIAAFLNTNGGTLLIGVDDAGTTLGIEPDFEYCQKEKQLGFRDQAAARAQARWTAWISSGVGWRGTPG